MLSERERAACEGIIANVEKGRRFTKGMTDETFEADERTVYAVVRCLEIISEASRCLSAETKARHPASNGVWSPMRETSIATDIIWLDSTWSGSR